MELAIRGLDLPLTTPLEELVRRRLAFALRPFGRRIRRVDVKLDDVNGPRGGVDKRCRVDVTLLEGGRVRSEGTEPWVRDAVDRAAHRMARLVGRLLGRRGALR